MRDISSEERRLALEQAFLHDICTTVTALAGTSELLTPERVAKRPELLDLARETAATLFREVNLQRFLSRSDATGLDISAAEIRPSGVLRRVEAILSSHPAAEGQTLVVEKPADDRPFATDVGLLTRVLVNMVVNGLEAGRRGDQVRIGCEEKEDRVVFFVWNRSPIPERVAARMFQRYFSTKSGDGRGTGTYSMKLLGESLLHGQVDFTTSETEGTTFRVRLPVRRRDA
jgi:signal transduction histidine kinase